FSHDDLTTNKEFILLSNLTQRLELVYGNRLATSDFDSHAALGEVLAAVGLWASDAGGNIAYQGADPVVKSPLRLESSTYPSRSTDWTGRGPNGLGSTSRPPA